MASGPGLLEAVLPREAWLWLAGDFCISKHHFGAEIGFERSQLVS